MKGMFKGVVVGTSERPVDGKDGKKRVYRKVYVADGTSEGQGFDFPYNDEVLAQKMMSDAKALMFKAVELIASIRVFDGSIAGLEVVNIKAGA